MTLTEQLPRRLVNLFLGLVGYGVSISLMLQAHLGNQPWDVFHQGLSLLTGLSIGTVLVIVGAAVLLCWIPLRQRPGIGTVANIIVLGIVVDVANLVIPAPSQLPVKVAYLLAGIVLCGAASGLYIGANLGPGPRDGLMTGLTRRFGWSLRGWRTLLEITVVAAGFLLGGEVGLGTIAYALAIGPLAQFFLPLLSVRPRPRQPSPALQPSLVHAASPRSAG